MRINVSNTQTGVKRIVMAIQQLSLARDIESVMKIVRTVAREITGADGATFILRDGDLCFYADEDAIAPLWKGQRFPMSACISGWVMLNKQVAVIEDIYTDERIPVDAYKPTFVKSLVMVPIRTIQPIGAIGNYWAKMHLPTAEEVELLQSLADVTAVTIENLQMYSELENKVKERTRELQIANKELESFSYSVSHDLRAPLRAITGYLSILKEDYSSALDDDGKNLIENVINNAQKMNVLIDSLLQFSRMERKELGKKLVPMKQIAEEVFSNVREQEGNHPIEFTIEDLPDIEADEMLIKQVWTNYISNAIKYSQYSSVSKIHIDYKENKDNVEYFIKDNGVGFDMQYSSKLFGIFQRLHTHDQFAGIGIGLSIVQRIVLKHGGKVWAEAKPNEGATFYFSLPK